VAEVKKVSVRNRAVRKVVKAAGGGLIEELNQRIVALEAEVQESRNLNVRVAELVDVVSQLMGPLASGDRARIEDALAKFERSL
jgi:hypothetical protein